MYHGFDPLEDIPTRLKDDGWIDKDVKRFFGIYRKTRVFYRDPFYKNPRRIKGQINLTRQELKAPTIEEWENELYEESKY